MREEELKAEILKIFDKVRQLPGSDFDESHFLDFLIHPASRKNNIKNSFKGVRKYYNFFSAVELRFGICFSLSDQDRFYSVDQFVSKTKERIGNSRGNKMIIKQRVSEKDHYYIEFFLTLTLALVIAFFKIHFITVIGVIFYGVALWWIVGSRLKSKRHDRELYKIIMKNME